MKILVVHNKYKQNGIGGEDRVYKVEADLLKKYGKDIEVYTYDVCNEDIKIFSLLASIWFNKKHYINIFNLVKEKSIDIVHVHNFFPLLTPSVFKAAKLAGAKVVLTLHNYRLWCISGILYRKNKVECQDCIKGSFLNGIRYKCYRYSYIQSLIASLAFKYYKIRNYFNYIDSYFVLSDFQKNIVKDLVPNNSSIVVKPNVVDLDYVNNKDKNDFLFVGLLDDSKGLNELLNTWKELGNNYQLTIIGVGSMYDKIKKMNLSNVKLLGKQPFDKVKEYLITSKYLLQTSLMYETFGLTIIEALSVGTPVIGFNIGTRPEFIRSGYNGYICIPSKLKDTVIEASNNNSYDVMSRNAVDSSRGFKPVIVIKKQLELYKQILES